MMHSYVANNPHVLVVTTPSEYFVENTSEEGILEGVKESDVIGIDYSILQTLIEENLQLLFDSFPEMKEESSFFRISPKIKRDEEGEMYLGITYVYFESVKVSNLFRGLTPEGERKVEKRILSHSSPPSKGGKRSWADEDEEEVNREVEVIVKPFTPKMWKDYTSYLDGTPLTECATLHLDFKLAEIDTTATDVTKSGVVLSLSNDSIISSPLPPNFENFQVGIDEILSFFKKFDTDGKMRYYFQDPTQYEMDKYPDSKKIVIEYSHGSNSAAYASLLCRRYELEYGVGTYQIYFSRLSSRVAPKKKCEKKRASPPHTSDGWRQVRK